MRKKLVFQVGCRREPREYKAISGLREICPHRVIEVLFAKYDANKDGVLDKKEAGTSREHLEDTESVASGIKHGNSNDVNKAC